MLAVWGLFFASVGILGNTNLRKGFTFLSQQEDCNVGSCLKFCETSVAPTTKTYVETRFSTKWVSSTTTNLVNKTNLVTETTRQTPLVTSTKIIEHNATASCQSSPSLVKRDTRDLTTATGTTTLSSTTIMPTTVSQSQAFVNITKTRVVDPTIITMTTNISERINGPTMIGNDFNPFVWISTHPELTGILRHLYNHNLS